MSEELKLCPFCGSQPDIIPEDPENEGDAWAQVLCSNEECGCLLPPYYTDEGNPFDEATQQWNTRADLASRTEAIGEVSGDRAEALDEFEALYAGSRVWVDYTDAAKWIGKFKETIRTSLTAPPAPSAVDIDGLANEIRRVDGSNSLGAGALAEALMPYIDHLLTGVTQAPADVKNQGENLSNSTPLEHAGAAVGNAINIAAEALINLPMTDGDTFGTLLHESDYVSGAVPLAEQITQTKALCRYIAWNAIHATPRPADAALQAADALAETCGYIDHAGMAKNLDALNAYFDARQQMRINA